MYLLTTSAGNLLGAVVLLGRDVGLMECAAAAGTPEIGAASVRCLARAALTSFLLLVLGAVAAAVGGLLGAPRELLGLRSPRRMARTEASPEEVPGAVPYPA